MTCSICGRNYHICASCSTIDAEYLHDGYCSRKCAELDNWVEQPYEVDIDDVQ